MRKNMTAPTLYVHSIPAIFGDAIMVNTEIYKKKISQSSYFESLYVDGSHHLHMVKPKETAEIVFNFLNKINNTIPPQKINSKI